MSSGKNAGVERPDLSVIIGTPDNASSVRYVMRALALQTARERVEVIIVAPSRELLDDFDESDYDGFFCVRVLEIGPFHTWAKAMVAGIEAAEAKVVVLAEDHAFMPPDWAQALIDSHARFPHVAAIGPAMATANPYTMCSRVHMTMDYGLWLDPHPGGAISDVPGHNSSYKRSALLQFDPATLERLIDRSSALHAEMIARGMELRIEPKARCFHLNPSKWTISFGMRFWAGRMLGTGRTNAGKWPLWLRTAYVLGSPLLPIMRLRYTLQNLRRSKRLHELLDPRFTGTLLLFTFIGVVGETLGYANGMGRTLINLDLFEFHRYRQMRGSDLARGAVCGDSVIPLSQPARPAEVVPA